METIKSNFLDIGLTVTITIQLGDGTIVISSGAMTDIGGGWYSYDFSGYDKTKQYLITTTDGTSVQSVINDLDSYTNKDDWKGGSRGAIVYGADESTIEARFKAMFEEYKNNTKPSNDLSPEIISKLEDIQNNLPKTSKLKLSTQKVDIDYNKIVTLIKKELDKKPKTQKTLAIKKEIVKIEKEKNTDIEDILDILEMLNENVDIQDEINQFINSL